MAAPLTHARHCDGRMDGWMDGWMDETSTDWTLQSESAAPLVFLFVCLFVFPPQMSASGQTHRMPENPITNYCHCNELIIIDEICCT